MINRRMRIFLSFFAWIGCLSIAYAENRPKDNEHIYEDKDVSIRIFLRSPEQMAAFYEGREFDKLAIQRISATCNVTVILKNKTADILWLVLDDWQFSRDDSPIHRLKRSYWSAEWDKINLSQAHRSTYGWTLLPEERDLYPNEGVGGSVTLPSQSQPFSLRFHFATGRNKQGKVKSITINHLSCQQNLPTS